MKYKICKLVDGNGFIKYRIKKKGWILWKWVSVACGPLGHHETLDFFSFEQASNWIKQYKENIQYYKNCQKLKVIECVEV